MSIIVEVTTVEADTLTVDVVVPPPVVVAVDVINPPPDIIAVEVVEFGGPPIGYPQLPAELRQLPISFPFGGKPGTGTVVNVPMGFSVTVPQEMAGTVAYAMVLPTAPLTFTFNQITSTSWTMLGMLTIMPTGAVQMSGFGGEIFAGEVLQVVSGPQDATASDIGITVMVNRE